MFGKQILFWVADNGVFFTTKTFLSTLEHILKFLGPGMCSRRVLRVEGKEERKPTMLTLVLVSQLEKRWGLWILCSSTDEAIPSTELIALVSFLVRSSSLTCRGRILWMLSERQPQCSWTDMTGRHFRDLWQREKNKWCTTCAEFHPLVQNHISSFRFSFCL